ncbi:hypothetical protein C0992_001642 [Termitomyces sp. T32_za158]|nr:hypothetical protein C0992_001642 [Termitomyces sp. T32_za158]
MLSSRPVALTMDSHVLPSKTPGRMKAKVENAVPMTVHAKGKKILIHTPFNGGKQGNPPHESHFFFTLKFTPANQKVPTTVQVQGKQKQTTSRTTLGDKTPFPNRSNIHKHETPAAQLLKLPVLSPLESRSQLQLDKTPESLRRPSSARTQDRVLRNASKLFVTPNNKGNCWDVSELCITPPEVETQEPQPLEDDYDEIEYMAPNTLHLAYEPPLDIELPDYTKVGKALFELSHTYMIDDIPVAEIVIDEKDLQLPGWDLLPLPELESDDPFQQSREPKAKISARTKTTPSTRQIASRTVARLPAHSLAPKSSIPPSTSTLVNKDLSSLRATSRGASIKSSVPSTSRTISKPTPPITAASRLDKLASKPTRTRSIVKPTAHSRLTSTSSTTPRRPVTLTYHSKTLPDSRRIAHSSGARKDEVDIIPLAVEVGNDLYEDFRFDV